MPLHWFHWFHCKDILISIPNLLVFSLSSYIQVRQGSLLTLLTQITLPGIKQEQLQQMRQNHRARSCLLWTVFISSLDKQKYGGQRQELRDSAEVIYDKETAFCQKTDFPRLSTKIKSEGDTAKAGKFSNRCKQDTRSEALGKTHDTVPVSQSEQRGYQTSRRCSRVLCCCESSCTFTLVTSNTHFVSVHSLSPGADGPQQ